MQRRFPTLCTGNLGVGADMMAIWSLLKSKEETGKWNKHFRGGLKSAAAGRQYTQSRCFAARFAQHNRCLVCLYHLLPDDSDKNGQARERTAMLPGPAPFSRTDLVQNRGTPPEKLLQQCPIGSMHHRAWVCEHTKAQRSKGISEQIVTAAVGMNGGDPLGDRGLYPAQIVAIPPKPAEATFEWVIRPPDGLVTGTIYTDGSRLDGKFPTLAVNGWAFVAINDSNQITAIARGIPPPWIGDIPGTEAWAVLQAALRRTPNAPLRIDCEPCVKAIHGGMKWATAAARKHARVNALLLSALEDTPNDIVVWMPAHTKEQDVGVKRLGDGSLLTIVDRQTNDLADKHAKLAAESVRAPEAIRIQTAEYHRNTKAAARWIGEITYTANHRDEPPLRDSVASKAKAVVAKIGRAKAKQKKARPAIEPRPASLGGHELHGTSDGGVKCYVCRHSSTNPRFCMWTCQGSVAEKWALAARKMADNGTTDGVATLACSAVTSSGAARAGRTPTLELMGSSTRAPENTQGRGTDASAEEGELSSSSSSTTCTRCPASPCRRQLRRRTGGMADSREPVRRTSTRSPKPSPDTAAKTRRWPGSMRRTLWQFSRRRRHSTLRTRRGRQSTGLEGSKRPRRFCQGRGRRRTKGSRPPRRKRRSSKGLGRGSNFKQSSVPVVPTGMLQERLMRLPGRTKAA